MRKWLVGMLLLAGLFMPLGYVNAASRDRGFVPPAPEETQPADLMGAEIIERAKKWVDAAVPYNQAGYLDGYRTDCAGFVSYAWQIQKPDGQTHSPDGVTLANQYGSLISFDQLRPGDILDNMRYGNEGHVVIFVKWLEEGVRFEAYEENGGENYNRAVATRLTLQALRDGGSTIVEYDQYAPGPYYAFRSQNIPGYAVVTGPPCVWKVPGQCVDKVAIGEVVTATFTIRNAGGHAMTINQLMAAGRGPWARVQGWYGPPADFPPDLNVTIQPEQSYTYNQSRSFTLVGDYFVEALLDEDGWETISPYPRVEFNVYNPAQ